MKHMRAGLHFNPRPELRGEGGAAASRTVGSGSFFTPLLANRPELGAAAAVAGAATPYQQPGQVPVS